MHLHGAAIWSPTMTTEGTVNNPISVHTERMRAEGIDVTSPSIVGLIRHLHDLIATVNMNTEVMRVIANRADNHYLASD